MKDFAQLLTIFARPLQPVIEVRKKDRGDGLMHQELKNASKLRQGLLKDLWPNHDPIMAVRMKHHHHPPR
jgi:hypothetical protein